MNASTTSAFVDLSGDTALTGIHADDEAVATVAALQARVRELSRAVTLVGSTSLRNVIEPLELSRIGVVGCDASLTIDPVCGMRELTAGEHAIGLRCADDQWWFRGMPCVASFATWRRAAS